MYFTRCLAQSYMYCRINRPRNSRLENTMLTKEGGLSYSRTIYTASRVIKILRLPNHIAYTRVRRTTPFASQALSNWITRKGADTFSDYEDEDIDYFRMQKLAYTKHDWKGNWQAAANSSSLHIFKIIVS